MGGSTSKPAAPTSAQQPNGNTPSRRQEDYNAPLANKVLPKDLQKLVDTEEETFWEQISEGHAPESTESSLRYAAYANRIRTILLSAQRYVAYTSDIGESFRPVAHPYLVRGAYGVSWAYLIGDVAHEGYKAYCHQQHIAQSGSSLAKDGAPVAIASSLQSSEGVAKLVNKTKSIGQDAPPSTAVALSSGVVPAIEDYRAVMAQRAVFQSIASMGLPAFTIHSIVRYSGQALKGAKSPRIRTWGPIGLGLAAVPFLPYMFDKPVEEAVGYSFHKAFELIGGPEAVGHARKEGNPQGQTTSGKVIEKEL